MKAELTLSPRGKFNAGDESRLARRTGKMATKLCITSVPAQ